MANSTIPSVVTLSNAIGFTSGLFSKGSEVRSVIHHRLNIDDIVKSVKISTQNIKVRQDIDDITFQPRDVNLNENIKNIDELLTDFEAKSDPLHWTKSVTPDYKKLFSETISKYKDIVTGVDPAFKNIQFVDTISDITESLINVSSFHRILNQFENTVTFTFKTAQSPTQIGKSLDQVLNTSDKSIRENDIIEFYITRIDPSTNISTKGQRVFIGFVGSIKQDESSPGTLDNTQVTCYGLSKLLGLTRVITDPAIFSQFESGTLEIDNPDFTPFQNFFAGKTVEGIFSYIMRNVFFLKPTIDKTGTSSDIQTKHQVVLDLREAITKNQEAEKSILFDTKSHIKRTYVDAVLAEVDKNKTFDTAPFDTRRTSIKNDTKLTIDQKSQKLKSIDSEQELAAAQKNLITSDDHTRVEKRLKDANTFLKLFPSADVTFRTEVINNFTTIKPAILEYVGEETKLRKNKLDLLQAENKLGAITPRDLQALKINYIFDTERLTNPKSFRTMYQILLLLKIIQDKDPNSSKFLAELGGGGDLFAYNRSFTQGWERFYSQLDYAETPLSEIRKQAYFDVFENESNQIVCRPPKYNSFDYANSMSFVITGDKILSSSKTRDDVNLQSRVDYYWYQPYVGSVPFHGGHYSDIGVLTKYGTRAEGPKSNPNAISVQLATLFSAMDLARNNSKTRTLTLTVVNDREYHLGCLYFIPDKFVTGKSLNDLIKFNNDESVTGVVGYLVDYSTTFQNGKLNEHVLTLTYVRQAVLGFTTPTMSTSGHEVTTFDDTVVTIPPLTELISFKRLPDLSTVINLAQKNQWLLQNQLKGVEKQNEDQSTVQPSSVRAEAVVDDSGVYQAFSKMTLRDLNARDWSTEITSVTPNIFIPSNQQNQVATSFQRPNFNWDGVNTVAQGLVDLLQVLDTMLKQDKVQSKFVNDLNIVKYPSRSIVTVPAGTHIIVNVGKKYPPSIGSPLAGSPEIIIASPFQFAVPNDKSLPKSGSGIFDLSTSFVDQPTTKSSTGDPHTIAFKGYLTADTTLYTFTATNFILNSDGSKTFTTVALPFKFSVQDLIASGSILAGVIPKAELESATPPVKDITKNAHFYGAAIDLCLAPWGVYLNGLINVTPQFLTDFELYLTHVFGPQIGDAAGWGRDSNVFISSTPENTTDSNTRTRYHLQVPFGLLQG